MKYPSLLKFIALVETLRKKCPWDKKQTHRSLIRYLREESLEAIDALRSGKPKEMEEELGDLLLQIVLHCTIAREKKTFDLNSVSKKIHDKMVRRHPHVFASARFSKDFRKTWWEEKAKEKKRKSVLDGAPRGLPGLQLSQRLGEGASSLGFDWNDPLSVLDKVSEELTELREAVARGRKSEIQDEMGDVFFSLAQGCRHLGLDAERVAEGGARKFERRFRKVEKEYRKRAEPWSMQMWEAAWLRAKAATGGRKSSPKQRK